MTTEVKLSRADAKAESGARAEVRRLQIGCWIALIAIAAVRAWFTRYEITGDSMSYLDIARAIAEGHPGVAIHAYWSPGYPMLISFFLRLFHPGPYWECPLAHLVNVLIFVGMLISFQLFWGELLQCHRQFTVVRESEIPEGTFWALGYAAFGIAALNFITVGLVGPDLFMAAFCCLAGWRILLLRRIPSTVRAVLLGVVLAMGYYVKAPFFPTAIVFILCACSGWPLSRRRILLAGTALITFLLICAPFIAALSHAKGRLTFGDNARLAQALIVNHVNDFWQGGPAGSGAPVHPTRVLSDYPRIYEFAAKDMGSYPAWFDPTYWHEGVTPHADWKRQIAILRSDLIWTEFSPVMQLGAALVYVLILLVLLTGYRKGIRKFWQLWFIWTPGMVALFMFAAVHVERRFLGGWLILLFAGIVCACSLPATPGTRRAAGCAAAAALITTGMVLILQASSEAIGIDHEAGRNAREAKMAVFLLHNGLHPDDNVALIGNGFMAYWTHLARLHLVAEIPARPSTYSDHSAKDFWEATKARQDEGLGVLERAGVRAVIADPRDAIAGSVPLTLSAPWRRIDGTNAYVYFFPAKQ